MTQPVKYTLSDDTWVYFLPGKVITYDAEIYDEDCIWHNPHGPARWNGYKNLYYVNGVLHRYDGPADEYFFSKDHPMDHWMIHGNSINKLTYLSWLDEMGMDIKNLTPEDKLLIDLRWGGDK